MSTSALICHGKGNFFVDTEYDLFTIVRLNRNGYPQHVFPVLKKYFRDSADVEELVSKEILSIETNGEYEQYKEKPIFTSSRAKVFEGTQLEEMMEEAGAEYIYFFNEKSSKWSYLKMKDVAYVDDLNEEQKSTKNNIIEEINNFL